MKPSDPPVVVEIYIEAPVEELWKAITELPQMHEWFFQELTEFEARTGFATEVSVEHDGETYVHRWLWKEVESPKRMVIDWQYDKYDGQGLVEWDLAAKNSGSTITLTNSIVREFPADNPAFSRQSCESGWQFLMTQLKNHVEQSVST